MTKEKPTNLAEDIQACIVSEWYINAGDAIVPDGFQPPVPAAHPLRQMTICVLVLNSGRVVHGGSYAAAGKEPNEELARRLARKDAEREIWPALDMEMARDLSPQEVVQ